MPFLSFPLFISCRRLFGLMTLSLACSISWGAPSARSSWGAIASQSRSYGYASRYPTRAAAEAAALAQCRRGAASPASCTVRAYFDRGCGALSEGNFGEWGAATALTLDAARKSALAQCDGHLPAEPCRIVVSACSLQ